MSATRIGLAVLIAAMISAAAGAQPNPGSPPMIDGPIDPKKAHWLKIPTGEELAAAYPRKAMVMAKSGTVRLNCLVKSDGFLGDCTVISESPSGYDFAAAAMSLIPYFRLRQGPYGPHASVEIPLSFNVVP